MSELIRRLEKYRHGDVISDRFLIKDAVSEIESLTAERDKYRAEAHLLTDERDAATAEVGRAQSVILTRTPSPALNDSSFFRSPSLMGCKAPLSL